MWTWALLACDGEAGRRVAAAVDDGGGDVSCIAIDAEEPARTPGVHPRQPDERQTFDIGDAAVLHGPSGTVEGTGLDPAVVGPIPDRPHDAGHAFIGQVEAGRLRVGLPARGVPSRFWCGDPLALDVRVDVRADGVVDGVRLVEGRTQRRLEGKRGVLAVAQRSV